MATTKPEAAKTTSAKSEVKYTAAELAANYRQLFGSLKKEVVVTALKLKGLEAATIDEAKKAVNEFLKREVK